MVDPVVRPLPTSCDACGELAEPPVALTGARLCATCGAELALSILDPRGSARVSYEDITAAGDVLEIAARRLRAARLSGFAGVRHGEASP
jgi:hypothetical protein